MKITLRTIATITFICALLSAIQAWFSSDTSFFENTIKNNIQLNKYFAGAASAIEDFEKVNGRPPTQEELEKLKPLECRMFQIKIGAFPKEALDAFGAPPAGNSGVYLLVETGSDIPKYWASWLHRSNAIVDSSKFFYFKNSATDTTFFALVAVFFVVLSLVFWQWPNKYKQRDRQTLRVRRPLL